MRTLAPLAAVAFLSMSGCLGYLQAGLADPGHVLPLSEGSTAVQLSAGGLAEGYPVYGTPYIPGVGGGVDVRAEHQVRQGVALGGELFVGAGGPGSPHSPFRPAGLAGARGFARSNPIANVAVIASVAASGVWGENSGPAPIIAGDATLAWCPWHNDVVEPYLYGGVHGAWVNSVAFGTNLGAGARAALTDELSLHAGLLAQAHTGGSPPNFALAVVPSVAIAHAGVSWRF